MFYLVRSIEIKFPRIDTVISFNYKFLLSVMSDMLTFFFKLTSVNSLKESKLHIIILQTKKVNSIDNNSLLWYHLLITDIAKAIERLH